MIIFLQNISCNISGKNIRDLTKIEGLQNLEDVAKIVLDNNYLTEITGLEILQDLQEISAKKIIFFQMDFS